MQTNQPEKPLVYVHIGDLHINTPLEQNYTDFLSIVSQIAVEYNAAIDFVYLPGDIADHAQAHQYKLVATAMKMLPVPVYSIPGDHDMEQGSLAGFYEGLRAARMPWLVVLKNVCCVFLDTCGSGAGGPDFRLGEAQLEWLKAGLEEHKEKDILLFMHTYPADLRDDGEKKNLMDLIKKYHIVLVDMGHTHYNEITNDGTTIYTATRSTGQIEEGPVGYSVVAFHRSIVSWRFKQLADPFPFVLITSPADYRLARSTGRQAEGEVEISAMIFGDRPIKTVQCYLNNERKISLQQESACFWRASIPVAGDEPTDITVEATDITGRPGRHTIRVAKPYYMGKSLTGDGSDADAISGWPDNHIMGTQLGPNRNAKPIK